jgi:hypothetical protein
MQATLEGLAATRDSRAAAILLAQAQPGIPERIRLSALAGLVELKEPMEHAHAQELVATVRAALDDPFLPVRMAGEQLVAAFALRQFRADVQTDLRSPLILQSELAQKVLEQLQQSGK